MNDSDTQAPSRKRFPIEINPPVFFGSATLILFFAAFGAIVPDSAERLFGWMQAQVTEGAGWFYVMAVAGFLVFESASPSPSSAT